MRVVSDPTHAYYLGNRVAQSLAWFVVPIVGVTLGDPVRAAIVCTALAVPIVVIFNTDRAWWPEAVRALPRDAERSARERRRLTIWSLTAVIAGSIVAAVLIGIS